MKVLVVDPGERVGWCHAEIIVPDPRSTTQFAPCLRVTGHGISTLKDFGLKVTEVYDNYDVVIYETWRLRADIARKMVGNDMQSSQLIGMVRLSSWQNPHVKLVAQGPAVMKTGDKVATPAVRAILDRLPKAHDESHDRSALLHLSYWYWKHYA